MTGGLAKILGELRAAHATSGCPSLRVLLLARNGGDWFRSHIDRKDELASWLAARPPRELGPVAEEPTKRAEVFADAVAVFAAALQRPAIASSSRVFDEERFKRVLYLHMAALASVEGLSFEADDLLDTILDHEERFWERRVREDDDLDIAAHLNLARQLVAAATLRGEFATKTEAQEQLKRLTCRPLDRQDDKLVMLLHRIYRCRGESAWQPGLEPDLLGEAMVFRALQKAEEAATELLDRIFEGAKFQALCRGFEVLGYLSERYSRPASKWIAHLLETELATRAIAALEAGKSAGTRTVHTSIGQELARALYRAGTRDIAINLNAAGVPDITVSMCEVGAWIAETILTSIPTEANDIGLYFRAATAARLSQHLRTCGRKEAAVAAAQTSLELMRELLNRSSGPQAGTVMRFEGDVAIGGTRSALSAALHTLGIALNDIGEHQRAADVITEEITLLQELEIIEPGIHLPDLAAGKISFSVSLANLNRQEEELTNSRETVEIFRKLETKRPGIYLDALASALNNLGNIFEKQALIQEQLSCASEALSFRRTIAARDPEAGVPHLVESLNNAGNALAHAGRHQEALPLLREAVSIRRSLSSSRFDAFGAGLGGSLRNLSQLFQTLHRPADAMEAIEDAIQVERKLIVRGAPASGGLAYSLCQKASLLADENRREDACSISREAEAEARRLWKDQPTVYRKLLGEQLDYLGQHLAALGRFDESLIAVSEAVQCFQDEFNSGAGNCLRGLSIVLRNQSKVQLTLKKHDEACVSATRSVDYAKRLRAKLGDTHIDQLCESLLQQIDSLTLAGRLFDAFTSAKELGTLEPLFHKRSAVLLSALAARLSELADDLERSGDALAAEDALQRTMAVLSRLDGPLPEHCFDSLQQSIVALSVRLHRGCRTVEAVACVEAAIRECGKHSDLPSARNWLTTQLINQANFLDDIDRTGEAVAASRHVQILVSPDDLERAATCAHNLVPMLAKLGRIDEALVEAERAVTLRRQLVERDGTSRHLRTLGQSLTSNALTLIDLDRLDDAALLYAEAVIALRLATDIDSQYRIDLADVLSDSAVNLCALERLEAAVAAVEESGTIYAGLSQEAPGLYERQLARHFEVSALVLSRQPEKRPAEELPVLAANVVRSNAPRARRGLT